MTTIEYAPLIWVIVWTMACSSPNLKDFAMR